MDYATSTTLLSSSAAPEETAVVAGVEVTPEPHSSSTSDSKSEVENIASEPSVAPSFNMPAAPQELPSSGQASLANRDEDEAPIASLPEPK